jgi:hypothetical protein
VLLVATDAIGVGDDVRVMVGRIGFAGLQEENFSRRIFGQPAG